MTRHLLSLALGLACGAAAACSGGGDEGYDGPGKNVVGEWIATGDHEVTIGEQIASSGGTAEFRVYAQGDQLYVEDGACAFPGLGEGNDRVSLMDSDSCVRNDVFGEALTYLVEDGSASVAPGEHFTLEIRGSVRPLGGDAAAGTFSIVYVGERAGGDGSDGDGDEEGDSDDPEDGSGGSGW